MVNGREFERRVNEATKLGSACLQGWKGYFGAAYSTRVEQAIAGAKESIRLLEELLEEDMRR